MKINKINDLLRIFCLAKFKTIVISSRGTARDFRP